MGNIDGGWVLPDVIDPPRKCFQIEIPDDFHHRAAFFGAIYELTRWYNWQRDDAHTAKDVAAVWKGIWRAANDKFYSQQGSCEMQTLLRMDSLCGILQVSYDGGTVWSNLVDIGSCVSAGVQSAVDNGQVGSPSQPGASGSVPVHDCKSYNVTLRGNERWMSPNPVEAGYTVIVQNAQGGWADTNSVLSEWSCPSGTAYTLGNCGVYRPTAPSDPLQSAAHMRLIGYCNSVWVDMYNQTYVVPNGTPLSNFTLQANDGDLSDNQGSITLRVTICNYSQWCYEFDFTVSDGGWVPDDIYAIYEPGVGWASQPGSGGRVLHMRKSITAGTLVTELRYWWHTDIAPDNIHGYPYYDSIGGWTYNGQDMSGQWFQDGQRETNFLGLMSGNGTGSGNGNGAHYWITKARITGVGINPFGVSNC